MPDPARTIAVESIRNDLDVLMSDILMAKGTISFIPVPSTSIQYTPSPSSKLQQRLKQSKPLLTRLTSPFKRIRARTQGKAYAQLDESSHLLPSSSSNKSVKSNKSNTTTDSATRRGSADTDATLVNEDNPDAWLELLAPLVSSLQKASLRISTLSDAPLDLTHTFDMACEKIMGVLGVAEVRVMDQVEIIDAHDLEMTGLMIEALRAKVGTERIKIAEIYKRDMTLSPPVEQHTGPEEDERLDALGDRKGPFSSSPTSSPLVPVSRNPFVVHSTSITLASGRRSSSTKSIQKSSPESTLSPFVGGAQQTWAKNVIRLGSFQNSALFSPSPIAVRKQTVSTLAKSRA